MEFNVNIIAERISALRKEMDKKGYDWFFCTSDDYHGSEYVSDYFKVREYYTGFTGENAFLLLNKENAYMWTDGRFFIQADIELKDTGVMLMKMGEPNVPTYTDFIKDNVKENETLFFDGRMVNCSLGQKLASIISSNNAKLVYDDSLAGDLWKERPNLPVSDLRIMGTEYVGESIDEKVQRIREKMDEVNAEYHFIGSIDDIAWITNVRGADVECNPVFLSYMLITKNKVVIFMEKEEVTDKIKEYFSNNNVMIEDYDNVLDYLETNEFKGKFLLDDSSVNFACYKKIEESKDTKIYADINPSKKMKSVKNAVEIENLLEAYLLDSVCVTKFIYWLKKTVGKEKITELSAAAHIDDLRREVEGFLDLSFPTISGYGSNGAIVHYSASEESNAEVKPEGMLLVDSGGQYLKGTTDVTRTVACGAVTKNMKLHYTKVAAGMLTLANARFLQGCTGRNLDILARNPLWSLNLDYKHGTGHGVGHILNVHEGPQSLRWQYTQNKEYIFEPGMITSDEPGLYIEGEYGIRIENVILCEEDTQNIYGKFLKFRHLTYAPLDRSLLSKEDLSQEEIKLVDEYQEQVYVKIKDFLTEEEAKWLRAETLPL